jgi:cellulose synthase (UDP-forming)
MDKLFSAMSTSKPLFTESQSQKEEEEKSQSIPFAPPGTPTTSSVDPAEAAQQAEEAVALSETVPMRAISTSKRPFTESQSQKEEEEKGQSIPFVPPATPTTSSVDPAKATQQVEEAVALSETVPMQIDPIELINTLHLPKTKAVSRSTRRKKSAQRKATINASVASVEASPPSSGSELQTSSLKPVMNGRQRVRYFLLLGIWLSSLVFFWSWWLRPEHVVTTAGIALNNLVLAWSTLLPGYYFFFVARMRQPDSSLSLPDGKVAIVVTKAPSEPWSVVEKTLLAMKAQQFPRAFDVWLADEDPSEESFQWCVAHGIFVSCRKKMPGYDNEVWPRRRKSKEGNLSYFYDTIGYRRYDFVAQLDADHVPEPDYLFNVILPFRDPAVGYVAAPSICDANASASWPARARLYAEAGLHGPMQAGYGAGFAPLCIGSHYAVRTQALDEIGGLGPELAEDHSTTFLLNASGWHGAFAFNAFAHGDGAECLADSVTQEFQWSRSLTKLLLTVTPQHLKKLPFRLKAQFLFAQLWYPLSCGNMFVICLLPLIALMTQTPLANTNYLSFLAHFMSTVFTCVLIVCWIKRQGWLRPINAKVLSWETWLFPLLCWPWTLLGVAHATISTVLKKELSFRVTPKGRTQAKPLPGRVLLPYTVIVLFTFLCAFLFPGGKAHTYHWFATLSIFLYTVLVWVGVLGHVYNNRTYSVRDVVSAIKGSLWQLPCTTACLLIDLQMHFGEILNVFVLH